MKQFIWMLCGIFLSGLLLGTLSACGADQFGVTVVTTGPASQEEASGAPTEPEAVPEKAPTEEEPPVEEPPEEVSAPATKEEARRLSYGKTLWDAYLAGVRDGGELLDWTSQEAAAENEFAIIDVDGDGEDELLLNWTNAVMAGNVCLVYGFDHSVVEEQLAVFPGSVFYDNGAVEDPWSHNQGWAGRFWPYSLYRYDAEAGTYEQVGSVDAWDRSLFEDDETLSAAFPADVDADGDGLVYYILTGDWSHNDRVPADGTLDGTLWGTDPVDGPDHEAWRQQVLNGAEPIHIPWQKLTEENIAALGAPKPDYPERVPLG